MLAPTPAPIRVCKIAVANAEEQGDVYEKIIQEVVDASKNDFEESGVGQGTLNELQLVSNHSPSCLLLSYLEAGPMHARLEYWRLQDCRVECDGGMGTLLRLVASLFADRWLIAAVSAIAATAISAQAGKAGGAQGSRAPGCPLLLHQRLKAICLPHSPTRSVTLNRLQLVCRITWSCPRSHHSS